MKNEFNTKINIRRAVTQGVVVAFIIIFQFFYGLYRIYTGEILRGIIDLASVAILFFV